MQIIELFATPASEEELQHYMESFNTDDDKDAAVIGYVYFQQIMETGDVDFPTLIEPIPQNSRIVAITAAGMTWNLRALQEEQAKERAHTNFILDATLMEVSNGIK